MPTYDYHCEHCDTEFTCYRSIKDETLPECPECGAKTVRKLVSKGTGFVLKGDGWEKKGGY